MVITWVRVFPLTVAVSVAELAAHTEERCAVRSEAVQLAIVLWISAWMPEHLGTRDMSTMDGVTGARRLTLEEWAG